MIYTSEDNWYYWTYGDNELFNRQISDLPLKTYFGKKLTQCLSFKEELINAARSTLNFNLTPDIFFSGGVDSEIMLRAFLELKTKINVFIVRYENDYNIYDVSYAVTICSMLNVNYKIIDFNLKKFYENEAEKISEISQIDRPRALPYCKFLELTDNLPILGGSDLSITRTNNNYNIKGTWINKCYEHDIGWSKYTRYINRQSIPEWFKWTPGLVLSFLSLKWCKKLINDKYYGKLGTNSTKIIGYREAYPEIIERKKQTGFEKINFLIDEFEKNLEKKYKGFPYRQEVVRSLTELNYEMTKS